MDTLKFIREPRTAIRIVEMQTKLRLRVTRVVYLDPFRKQAFAATLPPARQRGTATFCLHARAKSMLAFACALRWLISPFHKTEK
jgi:hypothetical protein